MFQLESADLEYYSEHDEWELLKPVEISVGKRNFRDFQMFDTMTLHIRLARRDLFYVIIFVMPNFLLYIMSGLVFVLPVESGEKVSFAITILLAEIVSFGSITDILPASSLNFPWIAFFLCIAIVQIAFSSLLTILGNFHHSCP